MPENKQQIQPLQRAASFVPDTFNEKENTIEVVAATEDAKVLRYGWEGLFEEQLSMTEGEIRLQRINNGASVLDNHDRWSGVRQGVVGVVVRAWVENKQLRAIVKFSTREDVKPLIADVRGGIVRNISIGYNVFRYVITEEQGKLPNYRATDWEPTEVSFVAVPADYTATVRSQSDKPSNEVVIISNKSKNNTMNRSSEILKLVRAAGLSIEFAQSLIDDESITVDKARTMIDAEKTRTATPITPAESAKPTPSSNNDSEAVRKEASKAATRRATDILNAVRSAGFDQEYAETLIADDSVTVDKAREMIIAKLAGSGTQQNETRAANTGIKVTKDGTDKRRIGMSNALLIRAGVEVKDLKPSDAGEFRGMDLMDMAKECLDEAGVKSRGMSKREVAAASLNIDDSTRTHSTSDFPIILGNTVNRSLRQAYELQERTFTPWTRRSTAADFRQMTRAQLGDLISMDSIVEGGEYKSAYVGEAGEKYSVVKYGKIIPITWETLVNDDLGAFSRIPQIIANSAASKQSDLVYAILSDNAAMADTVALFHATHANYTSSGTDISVTSLGVARAAMRKQTSLSGAKLNLTPRFLLVGPDKEALALQYTSQNYIAAKSADINVWVGMMQPIVEARISGTKWYLTANPNQIDTVEYAFLDGEELFTEQKTGFEIDGLQVKCRMVFGVKALDWRGLYHNVGA
jgi:phage head maturation protease